MAVLLTGLARAGLLLVYERWRAIRDRTHLEALAKLVRPGTTVIEVGVKMGLYTRRFAESVRPRGEVIAIEPEKARFSTLKRVISRHGLVNVKAVHAVASEKGAAALGKSANGHLGADAVRIDDLVAEAGWPAVSLIKIEVAGTEEPVLRGASETLRRSGPAVFMNLNNAAPKVGGSSAEAVFTLLASYGYESHHLVNGGLCRLGKGGVARCCREGTYIVFFLRPGG